MRVIVAGGGRVGLQTAVTLNERSHSVVVVERDDRRCEAIADEYAATVIEGDATDPDVLAQADPGVADVVAAMTGHQGTNLAVCLLADHLAGVRTVMRVDTQHGLAAYGDLVDDVVYPERLGAMSVVNAVAGGDVRALGDTFGDLDLLEIRVAEDAPVAGRRLEEISLPRGSLVVSDAAGNRLAAADTELTPDETYLVAVEPDVAEEIEQLFQG